MNPTTWSQLRTHTNYYPDEIRFVFSQGPEQKVFNNSCSFVYHLRFSASNETGYCHLPVPYRWIDVGISLVSCISACREKTRVLRLMIWALKKTCANTLLKTFRKKKGLWEVPVTPWYFWCRDAKLNCGHGDFQSIPPRFLTSSNNTTCWYCWISCFSILADILHFSRFWKVFLTQFLTQAIPHNLISLIKTYPQYPPSEWNSICLSILLIIKFCKKSIFSLRTADI